MLLFLREKTSRAILSIAEFKLLEVDDKIVKYTLGLEKKK